MHLVPCILGTNHLRGGRDCGCETQRFTIYPMFLRNQDSREHVVVTGGDVPHEVLEGCCNILDRLMCNLAFSISASSSRLFLFPLGCAKITLITKAWGKLKLMDKMVSMNIRGFLADFNANSLII